MSDVLVFLLVGTALGFILTEIIRFFSTLASPLLSSRKSRFLLRVPLQVRFIALLFVIIFAYDTGNMLHPFSEDVQSFFRTVTKGPISDFWQPDAINYARLKNRGHLAFFVGLLCGILFSIFVSLSRSGGKLTHRFRLRRVVGWAAVVIFLFVLLSPFIERITANSTSLELGQVGKITFASPQTSSSRGTGFTAGAASSSTATYRSNDVVDWLRALEQISRKSKQEQCLGYIQRDVIYVDLILRNRLMEEGPSNLNSTTTNPDSSMIKSVNIDEDFFSATEELPLCLRQYVEKFQDYRLLLVDVKPLIHVFSLMLNRDKPENQPNCQNDKLDSDYTQFCQNDKSRLRIMFTKAAKAISPMAEQISLLGIEDNKNYCKKLTVLDPEKIAKSFSVDSPLPYRTIALAYLLSAVGASDTAAIELDSWLQNANKKESKTEADLWYMIRAKTEISFVLQKIIDNREKSPIYRNFMHGLLKDFERLYRNHSVRGWTKSCKTQGYLQRLFFSSYIGVLNEYIKSAANIENISQEILAKARELRHVNMDCLSDLPGFEGDLDGWQANFLVTHASALVAASYSNSLFGKSPEKQKDLQEEARRDLRDALLLLARQEDKLAKNQTTASGAQCLPSEADQPSRSKLLDIWRWSGLRSSARDLLLRIGDDFD